MTEFVNGPYTTKRLKGQLNQHYSTSTVIAKLMVAKMSYTLKIQSILYSTTFTVEVDCKMTTRKN